MMNKIAEFIKENRKEAGLTQEEFAIRSGLGLRFVRELEQGKETIRMDKVNAALAMFDMEASSVKPMKDTLLLMTAPIWRAKAQVPYRLLYPSQKKHIPRRLYFPFLMA